MSKDHFYFSRNDRIIALILLGIIIGVNLVLNPWRKAVPETSVLTDSVITPRDTVRRTVFVRDTVRRKWYVRDTVIKEVTVNRDTARRVSYTVKVKPLSPLDLNASDSAQLVQLPGIGPATASRIIRYRNQLGGFADTLQLREIAGLPDSLIRWFVVTDTVPLRKLSLNTSSLSELRRHPYMDFYQARAIVEYRRERGRIEGPGQLSFMEEFTDRDLERLLPYLDFR